MDDYEADLFDDKMLLEIVLQLDQFVSTSQRKKAFTLDYLGLVGGFYTFISLLISVFGTFFSSNFFMASIANNFYFKKKYKTVYNIKLPFSFLNQHFSLKNFNFVSQQFELNKTFDGI